MENFTRLNDHFFSFQYDLEDASYASGVIFETKCSDEHFAEVFPRVGDMLGWVGAHAADIKEQTAGKLPPGADLDLFGTCWITSVSLLFDQGGALLANIAYGDDEGIYLVSTVKDKAVCFVELNL